jgi:hypothetical protein
MGACAELRIGVPPAELFPFLWARVAGWCRGLPAGASADEGGLGLDAGLLPARAQVLGAAPPRLLCYRVLGEQFEAVGSYELVGQGGSTLLRHAVEARALYRLAHLLVGPAEASAATQGLAGLGWLQAPGDVLPGPARP